MTAQIHEHLKLDGKRCRMACEIDLPESVPGLTYNSRENWCPAPSSCWRGYLGFWEVANGRFFLRKIMGNVKGRFRPPLFVEWFSGVIRVPCGKQLVYIHDEFESIYESDIFLETENGIVIKRWTEEHLVEDPREAMRRMAVEDLAYDLAHPAPKPYLP